jgi:transposase-like protein
MTKLTAEEERLRVEFIKAGLAKKQSLSKIAAGLGLSGDTLRSWWRNYNERGTPDVEVAPEVAPREVQNATFWRRKAAEAAARAEKAEHLAEELLAVRGVPIDPVPWPEAQMAGGGRSIGILHTSDWHAGERIKAGEILGINDYDAEVFRARMQRLFNAATTILPRWMGDDACDGILFTMAGDLISGDIHDELVTTNGLTSHQQVRLAVEVAETGIQRLADKFGRVHVVGVPGNHGRLTKKPWAKLSGAMSYDTMICGMVRDRLRSDQRVTWTIAEGADAQVPVYGRTILVTHGDAMGVGGGMGAVGPELPILRGAIKVNRQMHSVGQRCDLILAGHFHTSINGRGILANGSVVGYSEYGNKIRAAVEPPKQWLARFTMTYGLADRLDVQLTDPTPRMKMRAA